MSSNLDQQQAAFASDPEDIRAFEALQEHLFLEGKWDALAALYEHRLTAPSLANDPARRTSVQFRLAQLLEERCNRSDEAEPLYWEVAKAGGGHRPALQQLRHLYTRRDQWDMVLQTAELEMEAEMDAYERAVFLAEMGEVWLDRMGEAGEALSHFDRALEQDPKQPRALAGLARANEALGQAREAADAWKSLIDLIRGPERAPALVALGKLCAEPLQDAERAASCFRRAMTDDPRNEEAVEGLMSIALSQSHWPLLADLYERRFDLASGAKQRTSIALEAGHMHLERMHDIDTARRWFERAHELTDDDSAVHHALAAIARAELDRPALRAALDRMIDLQRDTVDVAILLEAVELHSDDESSNLARRYLEMAQSQSPDDPRVLDALSQVLMRSGDPRDRTVVLERRIAQSQDDAIATAAALRELSQIQLNELNDLDAATDALARAFAAHPAADGVTDELCGLYRQAERWPDLRALLERVHGGASGAEAARIGGALGQLLIEHFDDLDAATTLLEAALEQDPNDTSALRGLERIALASGNDPDRLRFYERELAATDDTDRIAEIVPAMLTLAAQQGAPAARGLAWAEKWLAACPDSLPALRAAIALQRQLGQSAELLQSLQRLEPLLSGSDQAGVRRELSELYFQQGDADASVRALEGAAESDPQDLDSLRALKLHYESNMQTQDLVRVQRRLVETVPDEERIECLDELVTLLDEKLGDVDAAIVVLWRMCGMTGCPTGASERLEALLERAGRFPELAQQLTERRRSMADESPEAEALDLRRAQLMMDQLGQVEEAAALFQGVLDRNSDCPAAAVGLEQALRSSNDAAALVRLLEAKAEQQRDPAERIRIDFERALILEEDLGDLAAALAVYATLADQNVDRELAKEADQRIMRVLERAEDWEALRTHLQARLAGCAAQDEFAMRQRIQLLCRDRLADRAGTIEQLVAMGELQPERAETWRDLATEYEAADSPLDLLGALERELECQPDEIRELQLRSRAARICQDVGQGGSETTDRDLRASAQDHYEHVLGLDPTHREASEFLIAHYEAASQPADIVRLLRARLVANPDAASLPEQTSLRLRIAQLLREALGDLPTAIDVLEEALTHGGPVAAIAEPLAGMYQQAVKHVQLAELCRLASRGTDVPAERATWLVRLGEALEESGDLRQASEAYCAALVDRPGDRDIEAVLRDLYRTLGDHKSLAGLLESEIDRLPGPSQTPLRMELAGLLAGELERADDAIDQVKRVLEAEPTNREAFDLAMEVSSELGRSDEVAQLIDARLSSLPRGEERAHLLELRGDLLAGPLGRPEEAASAYREAISIGPGRPQTRHALISVMERLERWPAVLDCLHLESQACDGPERETILERAVQIANEHVSSDAALPWLERLRAIRPDDADVVRQMGEVHRKAGRPEALLRALEVELTITTSSARQHELQIERARVLERDLHAPGRATAAYEAALACQPSAAPVLSELERLYDLLGRQRDRAEVIEQQIPSMAPEQRIALHRKLASVYAASLGDPHAAVPHALHALALTPADDALQRRELLRELAASLRASGAMDAWVRAATAELDELDPTRSDERARAAELHHELAGALIHDLGLAGAATEHLRCALDLAGAVASDSSVGLSDERRIQVEAELIDRLRAEANHVELAQRLGDRLQRCAASVEDWLELARLRSEVLHQPTAARDAYLHVLELEPGCLAALRGLRHVAEILADWSTVARTLEGELSLPSPGEPSEIAAMQRRLGNISWRKLDDPEKSIAAYRAALAASPSDLDSVRALRDVLLAMDRWSEAADALEREIELLEDAEPKRRYEAWLEVAQLANPQLDDEARALRAYEQASEIEALPTDDQRIWAELYRAADDLPRYAETFAVWCDDPRSNAGCWDQLALAGALRQQGRGEAALARAMSASNSDANNPEPWDLIAALNEEQGDIPAACDALERGAALREPRPGAELLLRAAGLCNADHADRALDLLRSATRLDPGLAPTHARLARLAGERDLHDEAEAAAARALDLAAADPGLDDDEQLACALIGGRAAHLLERHEAAARFYDAALVLDRENREALDAQIEVLFGCEEYGAAGELAQTRLDLRGDNPGRSWQLSVLARGLESGGDDGAALERYREALAIDAGLAAAHEGIIRIHEAADDRQQAIAALSRWVESDVKPSARAASRLRAAEHLLSLGDLTEAESWLRDAVADCPSESRAWARLVELLFELDRQDDALETATRALDHVDEAPLRARVCLIRGRVLDSKSEVPAAIEAYRAAVAGDARCVEATLAAARLLRSIGDWFRAAEGLQSFCESYPEPDDIALAQVHLECGRLQAGPLENVEGAIQSYERALVLSPGLHDAREPLAALLAHVPDRWREAVTRHCELLANEPTRISSVRALLEIAQRRDLTTARDIGLSLLRALGCASPDEQAQASDRLAMPLGRSEGLEGEAEETARQICRIATQEIAAVLGQEAPPGAPADFRSALRAAEGELTAPGLCDLPLEALSSLVFTVTALSTDPGGNCPDSPYKHTLDGQLGRWTRRKIRKQLGAHAIRDIQALDYEKWRDEVRLLAAAKAVGQTGGDLRSALIGLAQMARSESNERLADEEPTGERADISALVAGAPLASALLGQAVAIWCESIEAA